MKLPAVLALAAERRAARARFPKYTHDDMVRAQHTLLVDGLKVNRDYDPSPKLETITAAVLAINSADDVVNPPELG